MGQITAPIIAITLVLLSVFVPVAFIPGISGQLYQQFAVAVAVSMVISAINALTLSPALCAVLLRHHAGPKRGPIRYVLGAIDLGARRLCRHRRAAGARGRLQPGRGRRRPRAQRLAVQGDPRRLPAGGGPGGVLRRGPAARGCLGQPHRGRGRAGREASLQAIPGVADISTVVGYSTLDGLSKSNSAYFIVLLKPFDERTEPGQDVDSIIRRVRGRRCGDPRGQHHPVQRAADHRPRHQRRLRVPAARPAGRRSRRPGRRGARR